MDTSIIKEQISHTLEEILEQTETIKSYTYKTPQIEIDIVMQNIRKLYEFYKQFNQLNQQSKGIQKDTVPEKLQKEYFTPAAEPENKINKPKIIKEEAYKTPKKIDTETKSDTIKPPEDKSVSERKEPEKNPQPNNSIKKEALKQENTPAKEKQEVEIIEKDQKKNSAEKQAELFPTVSDKLKKNKKSIHENLSEKEDISIAAKLKKNPIRDMKTAIGINEKFLFINELFEGDIETYKYSIDLLNSQQSFEQAQEIFDKISRQYRWDNDHVTTLKLYEFVHRRYHK